MRTLALALALALSLAAEDKTTDQQKIAYLRAVADKLATEVMVHRLEAEKRQYLERYTEASKALDALIEQMRKESGVAKECTLDQAANWTCPEPK